MLGEATQFMWIETLNKRLAIVLFFLLGTLLWSPNALAADLENGAEVFSLNCAGCHLNGGNIIRRRKTLKQRALDRNGLNSVEAIANLVRQGKNNMSAYQDRLSDREIENVAAYVLLQAETGWRR